MVLQNLLQGVASSPLETTSLSFTGLRPQTETPFKANDFTEKLFSNIKKFNPKIKSLTNPHKGR